MISKNIYRTLYIGLYVFIAVALLFLIARSSYTEGFQTAAATAYPVCFLTVSPQEAYLDNLLKYTLTQPVFVVCDNDDYTAEVTFIIIIIILAA